MPKVPTQGRSITPALAGTIAIPIRQAAERINVSRAHLYNEIARGKLRTVKSGARRLVRLVDLHAYLEDSLVGGTNAVETAASAPKRQKP